MITKKSFSKTNQTSKIENLHCDSQQWKSHLHFMHNELNFIDHLLNSYVFEPNTPNLFERLQDFIAQLKKQKVIRTQMLQLIENHERDLGGMMQCTDKTCDLTYYLMHEKLKAEVVSCLENFRNLKTEVFNYAGEILKQRKPN